MSEGLSHLDVAALLSEVASPEDAAGRLGRTLAGDGLNPTERAAAEQVLRGMLDGAAVRVREVIAQTLKDSRFLPHDVATALAHDIASVAIPILEFSSVLTDEDLIAVVRSGERGKQVAVAGRHTVSTGLAGELLATGNPGAVARLVSNPGAELSPQQLDDATTRFSADPRVLGSLKARPGLPIGIAERLVAFTVDALRKFVAKRTDLDEAAITQLVLRTREQATVDLRAPHFPSEEAEELVRHLHAVGRLTPSLILRALCVGDLSLFEASLAQLAGIAVYNARLLIHDAGSLGFRSLYDRSGLPAGYFPAFRVALQVAQETQMDGLPYDRERYRRTMIERVLSQAEDRGATVAEDDLDYLLIRLEDVTPTLSPVQ
jgi:uncharacterized protein (DUF2336 family)